MKHQKYFIQQGLTVVFLLVLASSVNAGQFMINPKLGFASWADNVYTINGNTIVFDDSAQASIAVTGSYRFDNGLAAGVEILGTSVDSESESAGPKRGTASEGGLTAIGQYYFITEGTFQPYVGIGLGLHSVTLDDTNSDLEMSGYNAQVHIGGLFQIGDSFGFNVEYKYYTFDVEDDGNSANTIDTNVNWFGVGLSWRF